MPIPRILELIAGMITGASVVAVLVFLVYRSEGYLPLSVFAGLLVYGLPGLLVPVGAYVHSVKRRSWGKVIVWGVAVVSIIAITLSVLGGTIGYFGLRFVVYFLSPYFLSLITALITYTVVRSETHALKS